MGKENVAVHQKLWEIAVNDFLSHRSAHLYRADVWIHADHTLLYWAGDKKAPHLQSGPLELCCLRCPWEGYFLWHSIHPVEFLKANLQSAVWRLWLVLFTLLPLLLLCLCQPARATRIYGLDVHGMKPFWCFSCYWLLDPEQPQHTNIHEVLRNHQNWVFLGWEGCGKDAEDGNAADLRLWSLWKVTDKQSLNL